MNDTIVLVAPTLSIEKLSTRLVAAANRGRIYVHPFTWVDVFKCEVCVHNVFPKKPITLFKNKCGESTKRVEIMW